MSTDPQRNPPQNKRLYEQVNRRRSIKARIEPRTGHNLETISTGVRGDKLTFMSVLGSKPVPEVPLRHEEVLRECQRSC